MNSYLESREYHQRIVHVLNNLDPREADMVFMYYIKAIPMAEIAERFGITQAQVS